MSSDAESSEAEIRQMVVPKPHTGRETGTFPRRLRFQLFSKQDKATTLRLPSFSVMSEIKLKPVEAEASSSKPQPTKSLLKPWEFDYSPSPDGKDLNLLIMFHGLGTLIL